MAYPMSEKIFLKRLTAEHIKLCCLLNNEQQLFAFGQYDSRLEHHHLG